MSPERIEELMREYLKPTGLALTKAGLELAYRVAHEQRKADREILMGSPRYLATAGLLPELPSEPPR